MNFNKNKISKMNKLVKKSQIKDLKLEQGKTYTLFGTNLGGNAIVEKGASHDHDESREMYDLTSETITNPYFAILQDDGSLKGNESQVKAYLEFTKKEVIGHVYLGAMSPDKTQKPRDLIRKDQSGYSLCNILDQAPTYHEIDVLAYMLAGKSIL